MRTSFRPVAVAPALLLLAACGEPPKLEGTVVDPWGVPIEGATVQLEGVVAQVLTDSAGAFAFDRPEGTRRLMAGREGYILNTASVTIPADEDAEQPRPQIALYPEPEQPGFYGVARQPPLRHLDAKRLNTVGTEIRARTGLPDVGTVAMVGGEPTRFLFSSTLRSSELSRMGLQLHKLEFVDKTTLPGALGEEEVAVNLWVAGEAQPFDLKGLPSEDDYLVTTRGPLPAGVYAFNTEGLLTSADVDALARTPQEMQVAWPFEIK